ncbi:hypothetical protein JCM17960_08760 [Magnetospira thiophila]
MSDPTTWLVNRIRKRMRAAPKRHRLALAAEEAQGLYEANVANLPTDHLACHAGCGSCCCAHVGIEAPEAFAIARHLQRFGKADPTFIETLRTRAAQVGEMDPGRRWEAQIPCLFLDPAQQVCTIYPVRPLACRGYTSLDLRACEVSTETRDHAAPIPADLERVARANILRQALAQAAARTIHQADPTAHVELHGAVVAVLDGEDEAAWIRRHESP